MVYIVFDLEATCGVGIPAGECEIIEIGAAKLNSVGTVTETFNIYVKPQKYPVLTKFCKKLTGITQEQINSGYPISEAIKMFREWIGKDFILLSWGSDDKHQLHAECVQNNLDTKWMECHKDLRVLYGQITGNKRYGLMRALEAEGMEFTGSHHNGLDDAINSAKIVSRYWGQWKLHN